MPGYQQQQHISRQFRVRREHLFLFTRVRAARDPRGSRAAERSAQRAPLIRSTLIQFHVELDVADHASPGTLRADRNESLGVLGRLSRYQRTGGENSAKQAAEASIARN